MTAPIDIVCPACKVLPGRYCLALGVVNKVTLEFHHADRVDAAFRATASQRDDAQLLRVALRQALDQLDALIEDKEIYESDVRSFIVTTQETFGL